MSEGYYKLIWLLSAEFIMYYLIIQKADVLWVSFILSVYSRLRFKMSALESLHSGQFILTQLMTPNCHEAGIVYLAAITGAC